MFNGKGTYVFKTMHVYVGFWQNGHRCGDGALVDTDTLDHYEGNFYMDKYHGRGNYTYDIGQKRYEGDWLMGNTTGFGKLFYWDKLIYKGEFLDGGYHGRGTMFFDNGDVYNGEWQNGQRTGLGQLKLANGDVYSGQFKKGVFDGLANFTYMHGSVRYEGQWSNGQMTGRGARYLGKTRLYVGQFVNGTYKGVGVLLHSSSYHMHTSSHHTLTHLIIYSSAHHRISLSPSAKCFY